MADNQDTLSAALVIDESVLTSIDRYEGKLQELDKTVTSLAAGWKAKIESIGESIRALPSTVTMKLNVTGTDVKQLESIAKLAEKVNKTGLNGLRSPDKAEAQANEQIVTALNKQANTYEQITARVKELWRALNSLEAVQTKSPGYQFSESMVQNMDAALQRIMQLEQKVQSLGMVFDQVRANTALQEAVNMPSGNIDEVKAKFVALKKAKEEFMKPGGDETEKTSGLARVNQETEALRKNYDYLIAVQKKEAQAARDAGNATSDAARERKKAIQDANRTQKAQTRLTDALGLSEDSIDQVREKIRSLKSTISELRRAVGNPVGGNNQLNNATKEVDRLKLKLKELQGETTRTSTAAQGLGRMFAYAFNIYSVTRLIRSLVNIYGQFQMTERSLGVIIGDAVKARDIFNEIKGIAIKSPFQVSDLADYAKQLAAFRFETDQLVSTTMMLGDLSAGLGVDMGRLILAFGQVKAAQYLKLTEVRQFTEAGVDLLGGLADRFSDIEKRAVSVGEVMSRITKRMVTFKDVNVVLQGFTSAGGTFYKMQEKQAETVMGLVSNLKDRWQIAMDEIGSSSDGTIKAVINMITALLDHASALEVVLKSAMWGTGTAMTVKLLINGLGSVGKAIEKLKSAWEALRDAGSFKDLAKSANVYAVAIGAVIAAVSALIIAFNKRHQLEKELAQLESQTAQDQKDMAYQYSKLTLLINDNTKSLRQRKDALEQLKAEFGKILPVEDASIENIQALNNAYSTHIAMIRDYVAAKGQEMRALKIIEDINKQSEKASEKFADAYAYDTRAALGEKGIFASYEGVQSDLQGIYTKIQDEILGGNKEWIDAIESGTSAIYDKINEEISNFFGVDISQELSGVSFETKFIERIKKAYDRINQTTGTFSLRFNTKEIEKDINGIKDKYENYLKELLAMPEYEGNTAAATNKAQLWIVEQITGNPDDGAKSIKARIKEMLEKGEIDSEVAAQLENMMNANLGKISQSNIGKILTKRFEEINRELPNLKFQIGESSTLWDDSMQLDDYTKSVVNTRDELVQAIEDVRKAQNAADKSSPAGMTRLAASWEQLGFDSLESAERQVQAYNMLIASLPDTTKKKVKSSTSPSESDAKKVQNYLKTLANSLIDYYAKVGSINTEEADARWREAGALSLKAGVKLPDRATLTKETLSDWMENTLKPAISDSTVYADLDVKFREKVSGKTLSEINKTAESIKQKIEYALAFKDMDIDIEGFNLPDLYKQLSDAQSELESFGGDKAKEKADSIAEYLKGVYGSAQKEALTAIAKLNVKASGEMAKIFTEYQKSIKSIKNVNKDSGSTGITVPQPSIDEATANATKVLFESIDKQLWDMYKASEAYVKSFGTLDGINIDVLKMLRENLEATAKAQKSLSPNDAKAVAEALQKLDDAMTDRSFKSVGYFDTLVKGIGAVKEAYASIAPAFDEANAKLQTVKDEQTKWEEMKAKQMQSPGTYTDKEMESQLGKLTTAQDEYNTALEAYFKAIQNANSASDKLKNKLSSIESKLKETGDEVNNVFEFVKDLGDEFGAAFGGKMDSVISGFGSSFSLMTNAIHIANVGINTMQTLLDDTDEEAKKLLTTMLPLLAVVAVLGTLKTILNLRDAKKASEIEDLQAKVEELSQTFDNLKESMENAFNLEQIRNYNKEAADALEEQRKALEKAIEIEESRGSKKDSDNLKQMKQDLADINDSANELKETFYETLGVDSNWADAASDFAQNWLDAFNETGSGLSSLQDDFTAMFDNIVAAQIKNLVFGDYFENLKKTVEGYLSDGKLDAVEVSGIQQWRQNLEYMNQEAVDMLNQLGMSSGTGSGVTSSLQKGIESISETTADAIAGYMNSIKYMLSQMLGLQMAYTENLNAIVSPILIEMRSQTTILQRIEGNVSSALRGGHRLEGGSGFRVFMD